ncbi:MAG: hypothetical protein AABO57_00440 [Acidobacteriota bacterium]
MSRRFEVLVLLIAVALLSCASVLAADNKLEATGAFADPGASDALKKALEAKGWHVSLSGAAYCDIWLRNAVPGGKTDALGAVYTWIGDSTLIGVITFANATTDFRGQSVKAGSYTMRYAIHPTDGNHMGISPIRDFLVLLPVATDSSPDAQFKFEELTKMSTKVTGTSHPAILSLVQLASAQAAPRLEADENNHVAFSAAIKTKSGATMPIAFVVKGHAEQ